MQRLRQDARLFVQKGLVFCLIGCAQRVAGPGGCAVGLLQVPEDFRLQGAVGQQLGEGLQRFFPGLQLFLPPEQGLDPLPGVGQGGQLLFAAFQVRRRFPPLPGCFALLPLQRVPLGPQPGDLGDQALQHVIAGQLRLQLALFILAPVQFRLPGLLLLIGRAGRLMAQLFRLISVLRLNERRFCLFLRLQFAEPGVDGLEFLFQEADALRQVFFLFLILPDQRFQEVQRLFGGQFAGPGPFHFGAQRVVRRCRDAGANLLQAALRREPLGAQRCGVLLQTLLQALIALRFEHLPQDLFPVLRGSQQEFQELPLGDHGDLHELAPVHAHDVPDGRVHLLPLCLEMPVGVQQRGLRLLPDKALAPGFRPLILRAARDGIGFPGAGELQLHLGGDGGFRIFRAQHGYVADVPAGSSVEGKGDGVKNRGLARAGVPRDQVQALAAQPVQVQDRLLRVGAKGGDAQLARSHASSSHVAAIRSFR